METNIVKKTIFTDIDRVLLDHLNSSLQFTRPADGMYYKGVYDFILREGNFFQSQKLTQDELDWVHKRLKALNVDPDRNKSYNNSQKLAISDSAERIKYVEGVAGSNNSFVLHGWCEINGKIIDINWTKNDTPIIGYIPDGYSYIGVTFPTSLVRSTRLKIHIKNSKNMAMIDNSDLEWPLLKKKFEI